MKTTLKVFSILLTAFGTLYFMDIAFQGSGHLTEATKGVGYIAFACAIGIAIRIVQAELHHHSTDKK